MTLLPKKQTPRPMPKAKVVPSQRQAAPDRADVERALVDDGRDADMMQFVVTGPSGGVGVLSQEEPLPAAMFEAPPPPAEAAEGIGLPELGAWRAWAEQHEQLDLASVLDTDIVAQALASMSAPLVLALHRSVPIGTETRSTEVSGRLTLGQDGPTFQIDARRGSRLASEHGKPLGGTITFPPAALTHELALAFDDDERFADLAWRAALEATPDALPRLTLERTEAGWEVRLAG